MAYDHYEQLPLAVQLRDEATFDNFYAGANQLLINELKRQLDNGERYIYLFGAAGSGRSHLLQAACHHADQCGHRSVYLPLDELKDYPPQQLFTGLEQMTLVCLDNVDRVIGSEVWEEALFHLFNRLLEAQVYLLVAADRSPRELKPNLADLASRLSWGSLYQLKSDSDDDQKTILQFRAERRGIEMPDDVAQFIYHRCQRDTHSLLNVLDKLDAASLKAQRKLTIPFVKATMRW